MNLLKSAILFAACLFAAAVRAEPVTLSNAEAARLFGAMRSTAAGVSALNTRNGAMAINILRPVVESYEAGQRVIIAKELKIADNDPARGEKRLKIAEEADALAKATNKVDLILFSLTDDEIKDAKIPMDSLAEMIRWLSPPAKK